MLVWGGRAVLDWFPMAFPSPIRPAVRARLPHLALVAMMAAWGCAGPAAGPGPAGAPATAPAGAASAAPAPKVYGAPIDNGAVGRAPANGKTFFALYLMGSDLEDDLRPRNGVSDEVDNGGPVPSGNGTADLKQLVEGYQALSEAERANVDVLVALGGARKASWQGIKYLDLPMLVADAEDGTFGDDGPYLYEDPKADMSADEVFKGFLTRVQARSAGAGKVMVTLWDHGGAYLGVGPDTNHAGPAGQGVLFLERIKADLAATRFKADLIGFDACLMGNLEVATALQDHFDYLVASEEVEPSHGWDYALIMDAMGKRPTLSALDLGKRVVDVFIESPANQRSKRRTLSVNDLSRTRDVVASLDDLARAFRDRLVPEYQAVLTASGKSQFFGRDVAPGSEFALDLRDFTAHVRAAAAPDTRPQTAAVDAALTRMVAYARESGEKPNAAGLSIFSPVNLEFVDKGYYNDERAATANWFDYVGKFAAHAKTATAAPTIGAEAPAAGAPLAALRRLLAFQAPALGADAGEAFRMTVAATPGVARVSAMHVVRPDPARNRYLVVSSDRVDPDPDGTYLLPGWDGAAIHLADDAGGGRLAPLTFDGSTVRGTAVYVAPARVNDEEASVYLEWDPLAAAAVDQWVVPFRLPEQGAAMVPKLQHELVAGDRVAFYESTIDTDADGKAAALQPPLTLGSAPRWRRTPVAGEKFYFLFAEDLAGRVTASPLHLVVELLPGLGL